MRSAIIISLLLTACYKKEDAIKQLKAMGRPNPIACVSLNGQEGTDRSSFTCSDGAGFVWACDQDACINTGTIPAELR
jgi:hypothetical protein